ncbi:MAG TPA: UDP-2,3-diacylglucosamine diphosphatase LpxI [Alphaproteobacteria bacterium]
MPPDPASLPVAPAAGRLGVLAGGGRLPRVVLEACRRQGREVFAVAFEGSTDPETVTDMPHQWVRLGAVGQTIALLKANRVEELVMAGPVARPSWAGMRPDLRALKLLPKVLAGGQGDDSILSLAIRELEAEGFRVVGAHAVVPELLAPAGPLGARVPDRGARADIARGVEVAMALGAVDVGQAVVVQQGVVLGIEAVEGTDALLGRAATLRRDGPGGVLVKCRKPSQDRRADLPSIGADTVRRAREAGLRGIAVEAGETLVLDRALVIEAADAGGLFVYGFEGGPG